MWLEAKLIELCGETSSQRLWNNAKIFVQHGGNTEIIMPRGFIATTEEVRKRLTTMLTSTSTVSIFVASEGRAERRRG